MARTNYLDWNATLADVEKEVASVQAEGDFPEVEFANLKDGAHLPADSELRVEVRATDKHGLRNVKLYMNGLLVKGAEPVGDNYVWSAASDDLLQAMPTGPYHLAVVAIARSGTRTQEEIQVKVGKVANNARSDRWMDAIHQVIMKEGDRMMALEEVQLPRLECKLRVNGDGKMVLIHSELGLVFKTWSKDDDGPHFATLENGQLRCYRGPPGNPQLVLWESPKPKKAGGGPCRLGITNARRMIIFQDGADGKTEIVWRGPVQN
jgi:hypothetical protein